MSYLLFVTWKSVEAHLRCGKLAICLDQMIHAVLKIQNKISPETEKYFIRYLLKTGKI